MSAVYYEGNSRFSLDACRIVAPGRQDIRLRVAYCGICGTDVHIARGAMESRVRTPQVIGHEMSGIVEEVGADVEGFAVGDGVVVRPLDSRGETPADRGMSHICRDLKFLGIDTPGAFQAFWTVPAFTVHRLPPGVDLRLAAMVEPLAVATHSIRLGEVRAGETVVVIGGGPIGLMIGLAAQAVGANVVVSEINEHRLALGSAFGFDCVNPNQRDIAAYIEELTNGAGADVVFEVSGSASGAAVMTKLAGLRSRIAVVAIFPEPTPISLFDLFWKELRLCGLRVYEREDFERAITLVADEPNRFEPLVTSIEPLERLPNLFETLGERSSDIKILVDCQA